MRIRIHGGRVIDPAQRLDGEHDLYLVEGRVAAIGAAPDGFVADRELDVSGQIVIPGIVDLCARLREPGHEKKATIASECEAAAAAGITTLCMPPDTDPVIDESAVVELIHQKAERAGKANVVTLAALTQGLRGEQLAEMAVLKGAGCVGVSNARRPLLNNQVLLRAMEYAATHRLTVFIEPMDAALMDGGCAHRGAVASRMGLPVIPEAAETAAVAAALALAEQAGARVHFGRLSTRRAARMVAYAREQGLPVSADVAAHQLFLTEMDIAGFNAECHVRPPLRTERDRDGLREALASGAVSAICSDHQPHEADAKLAPFPATEPGISALETLLPLALRLAEQGLMSLPEVVATLTCNPAQILGIRAGTLEPGARADLCIFDPSAPWRLQRSEMKSKGRNTPFAGWEFRGRVTRTLLAGKSVYQAG